MMELQGIERCRQCVSRDFVNGRGLLCKITGSAPQVEEVCQQFSQDEELARVAPLPQEEGEFYTVEQLLKEENLLMGTLAGLGAALVGAAIWGAVSIATGYQIGYMAVGMGLLVGFVMRGFGKGVRPVFGITGALLALLGCVLGDAISIMGAISNTFGMPMATLIAEMDYAVLAELLWENLLSMTALFYALALFEGYKLSFRVWIEQESGKI